MHESNAPSQLLRDPRPGAAGCCRSRAAWLSGALRRRRGSIAALAVAAALALGGAGGAGAQPSGPGKELPSLTERLSVREVELVFEQPLGKGLRDLRLSDAQPADPKAPGYVRFAVPELHGMSDLEPAHFLVLEDGKARPVLRLEPLAATAHPWSLRIYFDRVLAHPNTVFEAAIALAYQAGQLAELGTVEIVVADPDPRTVLAPSREAAAIEEVLAALAGQSRRDPRATLFAPSPPPPPATVRRQCDRLVTSLAEAVTRGPHALLLVADLPALSAAELHQLTAAAAATAIAPAAAATVAAPTAAATDPEGAGGHAGPTRPAAAAPIALAAPAAADEGTALALGETARLLAAYGWVTLALPIHRLAGGREAVPEDDYSRFRRQTWEDPHTPGAIPFLPLLYMLIQKARGKQLPVAPDVRLLTPRFEMEDVALAALVRPTAGLVVPYRASLAPALGALAARWHLWYQADASPAGRERSVTVSLLAGGQEVRTARWVRSSTPESVAAARLRRSLAGDSVAAPLQVSVALLEEPPAAGAQAADGAAAPGPAILLTQAAPAAGDRNSLPGPLRISFAWSDARGTVVITHQRLDARAADLWNRRHALRLAPPRPPPGHQALGVLIEDLATQLWGCAVLAIPDRTESSSASGAASGSC
ncbi:MAG TPA: hypothetical protein VHQ90_01815 [Thermoanaerobaculia bacterium]|nr:hypothetical protein [Thermoanaerobaculia bacterium]